MKQLVISQNDIYEVNGMKYFKFIYPDYHMVIRDIPCDLSKSSKHILKLICRYCELNINSTLTKTNLIDLILGNNCLILEK